MWWALAHLRLNVVAGDDVADGPQRRGDDALLRMHQKFDESTADAGIDDRLNLFVGAVGEVAQCPAGVGLSRKRKIRDFSMGPKRSNPK